MMRNIDNERTRFGIYGSLVAHLLALLLIAFTGVLQSGAHNLSDVTEIAFMGGGGGGGGGQGDGSSAELQEPGAPEAGSEEEEQAEQPAAEPAEDVITESAGESRQEPKPRVQPQAAAAAKKAADAPKKRGSAPGSGGGIGTGHGTGIGSGTGPGSGSGSGGGHGSGHGTGIGSGIGPGSGIASSPAVPPRIVQSVAPYYPAALKQQGVEGLTVVRLVVGTNGAVESAEILRSSGNGTLDSSALDAARQWRFTAAKNSAGQKVRCYFDLPLRFRITYN